MGVCAPPLQGSPPLGREGFPPPPVDLSGPLPPGGFSPFNTSSSDLFLLFLPFFAPGRPYKFAAACSWNPPLMNRDEPWISVPMLPTERRAKRGTNTNNVATISPCNRTLSIEACGGASIEPFNNLEIDKWQRTDPTRSILSRPEVVIRFTRRAARLGRLTWPRSRMIDARGGQSVRHNSSQPGVGEAMHAGDTKVTGS